MFPKASSWSFFISSVLSFYKTSAGTSFSFSLTDEESYDIICSSFCGTFIGGGDYFRGTFIGGGDSFWGTFLSGSGDFFG